MLPLMYPQNKIAGTSIAWGRAVWDYDVGCYAFVDKDSYEIRVTDQWMEEEDITEDDLLDCIAQAEEMLGSPDLHRVSLGLFHNSGYSNIGTTFVSRSNPAVTAVFTPTENELTNVTAYFEWYYNPSHPSKVNLKDFMIGFDQMTGNRETNMAVSPAMPSYEMASKTLIRKNSISESEKNVFLEKVWQFHRTTSKGYKIRLTEELLPRWEKMKNAK